MKKWIALLLALVMLASYALCAPAALAEEGQTMTVSESETQTTGQETESASETASEPAPESSSEPEREPEPSSEPASEPETEPETEPSSAPETEPSSEPETQPSSEPETEPSSEAATEPSSEAATEPSSEAATEPSSEAATEPSSEAATEPSSEAATEPSAEPTTEPETKPTQAAPAPAAVPGIPVVTKHPTGETVDEGGYAEFVARADYATEIIWLLSDPTGSTEIRAEEAPNRFPGLMVTGLNSERLGLDRIPSGLNEWRVRARFVGREGTVYSGHAVVVVKVKDLTAPTLVLEPDDLTLDLNNPGSLKVVASSPDPGARLTYQWYMNSENSNVGGKVIYAANADTYTPEPIQGVTYYYCAVRAVDGTNFSLPVKSRCAAVTYDRALAPATVPTHAPETEPATEEPTPDDATEETMPAPAPRKDNTLLTIVIALIATVLLLGVLATVLIIRHFTAETEDEDEEEIEDED